MNDFAPHDAEFAQRVRDSFGRQGAMAHIGARLTRVDPGVVTIELPFRPELSQQHGFFHAGMTSAIADSAGGYAAFSLMPADSSVLTVEFKLNLIAPADGELLIATGRVVKPGRTLTICELAVEVGKGGQRRRCALGLQTMMCLHGRPDRAAGS